MVRRTLLTPVVLWLLAAAALPALAARSLTFEDRVRAQEAIERVYYSHQIGATVAFEQAVPRPLLERKVRTYLKQSVALDEIWHTPVNAEMLERETDRISAGTRMPERLVELYRALGDDAFMFQETVARATLVERLARDYYAAAHSDGPPWETWWASSCARFDEALALTVAAPAHPLPVPPQAPSGAPASLSAPGDSWIRTSLENAPDPSDQGTAVWTGSEMIAWGGNYFYGTNAGSIYTPATNTWRPISKIGAPAPRWGHTAVWSGSRMLVWGGATASAGFNDGAQYDPVADAWTPLATAGAPPARVHHTAVWTGSKMIVWGGEKWLGNGVRFGNGASYDPQTDSWTLISLVNAPAARTFHTAVWTGQQMIIWGGSDGSVDPALASGARYDPAGNTWQTLNAVNAPVGRFSHTAVWTGKRMIVWGGLNTTPGNPLPELNSGATYTPATDSWITTNVVGAPNGRWSHSAIWTGSRMIVWGGQGHGFTPLLNSGGVFDPASNRWSRTAKAGAPTARINHFAFWTGTRMLIWSGEDLLTSISTNTGGQYNPSSNSWTPTSTGSRPTPRTRHTTVWTGNEMIVWGGLRTIYVNGTETDTGGRFDPVLDQWTPTSLTGAPAARAEAVAVWTGSQMIVWGGESGGLSLNTGGRYNPISDTWLPITSAGSVFVDWLSAAVWTGSDMFVANRDGLGQGRYSPQTDTWAPVNPVGAPPPGFGTPAGVWTGTEVFLFANSVLSFSALYNPLTDTWRPASITGALNPDYDVQAHWTGDRVLVYGAYSGFGGFYEPATDSWSSIAAGSPRDCSGAQQIWTGSELLVWGGLACSLNYSVEIPGQRYDPGTDTWTDLPIPPRIPGRFGHSMVWTGREMIVWGGAIDPTDANPVLSTGGIYIP